MNLLRPHLQARHNVLQFNGRLIYATARFMTTTPAIGPNATDSTQITSGEIEKTDIEPNASDSTKISSDVIEKTSKKRDVKIVHKKSRKLSKLLRRSISRMAQTKKESSKEAESSQAWSELSYGSYQPVKAPSDIPIPTLAHGLDRVLFNPGVHYLRDPRTGYCNFEPLLENLTQPDDFNFDSLQPFIPSSRDKNLLQMARDMGKRFVGSTSSVSGALSQCYFALTNFNPVDVSPLSTAFADQPKTFTKGARTPVTVNLRWDNGVHAVEADKSYDIDETILSVMGKSMEKFLTLDQDAYGRHLKNTDNPILDEKHRPEAFAYGEIGDLLLRSQLDCCDDRLVRKTFDLKTRAVIPIRLDILNYSDYFGYTLKRSHGLFESFEREYYDMMRSAFLKYSFQVRIGQMDGILVAYHNTQKIFGFQYISREEIDSRVFGSTKMANMAFDHSLNLLHLALNKATSLMPDKTLRISFDARDVASKSNGYLNVFVEPMPLDDKIDDLSQNESPELKAEEFFSTDDMSVDPYPGLAMFRIDLASYVNGVKWRNPVSTKRKKDKWTVKYNITDGEYSEEFKSTTFRALRKKQLGLVTSRPSQNGILKMLKSMSDKSVKTKKDHEDRS